MNWFFTAFTKDPSLGFNDRENARYQYNDASPAGSTIYYRIKIIEQGQATYSKTVQLNDRSSMERVRLYPQPATSTVTLELNKSPLLNTIATLVDNHGRVLRQIKLTQQRQPIDITTLNPGMYYVRLVDGEVLKLIVAGQ